MKQFLTAVLLVAGLHAAAQTATDNRSIDLSGQWQLTLDGQEAGTVVLPGTTDTNKKGHFIGQSDETTHLTRPYSFKGLACYTRSIDIPKAWKKKPLTLFLERTKFTKVYLDGVLLDSCNFLSTPHVYRLPALKAGRHTLAIAVDNSRGIPEQIYSSSHATTEDTQTNWNGIIGKILLSTEDVTAIRSVATAGPTHPAFRNFHIEGRHFYANGHRTFLRGKHDAAVWPLTGHCPMDTASWRRYFGICAEYGINHVRFHSWCPPEAAFTVADEMGIYLQPELPFWGSFDANDRVLMNFLHREGENILRTYGHHPSFVMFALGNELWGSIDEMAHFVQDFRAICPHILFTFGSNYYLGYKGVQPGMDYFTTCRVGGEAWGSYDTHTRGSFSFADAREGGLINAEYPGTLRTLDDGCRRSEVPVISHETGQFQTYPDYDEIEKYTGVLRPDNLEIFRARLDSAGMLDQAYDFHLASGRWSVQLYKADIELDLRTESMAGFQLLDIQDYPGQGSAYVGILDAFMDSKHITYSSDWRQWCDSVVMLASFPSYTYYNKGTLRAHIQIANYSGRSLRGKSVVCGLSYQTENYGGAPIGSGQGQWLKVESDADGLIDVGDVEFELDDVEGAQQCKLIVKLIDLDHAEVQTENEWPIWVYPEADVTAGNIIVTHAMSDEIGKKLADGARVLWMPDTTQLQRNTVGGLFQTDYWNYRMFKTICEKNHKPVSPGTLGILCDPEHALFSEFPTENHTNWQWFPIVKASRPLILDNLPKSYRPLVQVIDNIERNHRLGLISEFAVGKG